jgi:glycolate oxidase FAD binding subunit
VKYPQNEREVSNLIKKFYKSNIPIELVGSGSKKKMGKLLQCDKTLNLSKLNGIIEYLPEELYIKVRAGTLIKQIEEELKKTNNN